MIIEILLVLAAILVVLAIVIARRPSTFRVSRSAAIPAPDSVVFAEVNDLHRWTAWSPWTRLDPQAENIYEGSPSGVGSIMRWKGKKTGEGGMTILESQPDRLIRIKLEFIKPFRATNLVEFTFQPQENGTLVTWTMTGTNSFVAKAMGLFINCDQMCGRMFEDGLANLKTVTEEMAVSR
jgi:hypothetical protein